MALMKRATKPMAPTRVFSALVYRIIWVTATAAMGWALAATAAIPFTVGAVILAASRFSIGLERFHVFPITAVPAIPTMAIPTTLQASARLSSIDRWSQWAKTTTSAMSATSAPLPGLFP